MALPSPSSTPRQYVAPVDSPPSEGGSGNGARADIARKTKEVENLFANFKKEGVEINDKIACIIDDEITRIKVEVDRENTINGRKRNGLIVLLTITTAAIGFFLGVDRVEHSLYAQVGKIVLGE
ncbi:unnamed protein product [Alopecurus aequalis]